MELDIIKSQTTWNDASQSINLNFAKIRQALASRGGGGGNIDALISTVYDISYLGSISTNDNSATFNAYAIDSLYKRIKILEEKEVDFTGYATEQWVLNKSYITSAALSPYLKTSDANSTFATLVAFNALSNKTNALEGGLETLQGNHSDLSNEVESLDDNLGTLSSNFNTLKGRFDALDDALNDDVSGKINTWNEIVDFLNEYNGSKDLATILSGMNADIALRLKTADFDAWKTDVYSPLASRVSTAEGNISTHTTQISGLTTRMGNAETNISTNAKGIADNKTAIATNKGNISANATAITNLGKRVTANEGNIAEILKWFAVDADGNLYTTYNLYSTKEISANGLSIGSGSSGGGLISQVYGITAFGTIASESNSATFNAYAIDSLYKRIVSLEGKATAVSFVPALTSGKQIGTLSIDGVSTVLYGVDAYSKTDADNIFLKLWGGTVTGNLNVLHKTSAIPLLVENKAQNYTAIAFRGANSNTAYLVYSGNGDEWAVTPPNWAGSRILLHSGNYSQYALPLSGGTVTGVVRIDTANSDIFFGIRQSGSDKSAFGWSITDGTYMYSYKSSRVLGIKDDGTPFLGTTSAHYTLLHSGNYSNYALPLTGGTIKNGDNGTPLVIDTTHTEIGVPFRINNINKGWVGHTASIGTYLYDYTSKKFIGVKTDGTPVYYDGSYRTLYHTGNFNPANYLPLTGGTISGSGDFAYVQLRIKGTSIPNIMFEVGSSEKGAIGWTANEGMRFTNAAASAYIGIKDNGTPHYNGNTLLHSGNYSNYALPLTGGSIVSSTIGCPLYLANTKETWNAIGFKGKSHSDNAYLGLGGDGNFFVTTTGWTAAYGLIHSGNYSQYALPLSGGTLTGKLTTGQRVVLNGSILELCESSGSGGIMLWNGVSSGDGVRNLMIYDGASWNRAIHSGNIGSYALKTDGSNKMSSRAYLDWSTTEGTENYSAYSGGIRILGYNASTDNYSGGIHVGTRYGWQLVRDGLTDTMKVRYRKVDTTTWNEWKTIAFTDSTVDKAKSVVDANGNALTLIHSGNIGSQNAGSANMLKYIGQIGSSGFNANTDLAEGGFIRNYGTASWWGSSVPSTFSYGVIYQLQGSPSGADLAGQIAWDIDHHGADSTRSLWWRANDDTAFANAKWHQIAFTDSNVASATKLATARTIWGQSFDGSGNVSGNIQGGKANFTIYGYNSTLASNVNILTHDNNKSLWLGYGMNAEGNATIIAGTGIEFRYGASRGVAAFINSSGNVTIGSSDLAGTSYKLYVNGTVNIANALTVATNVQIPINGDRITFCSATGTYTKGIIAMNASNTYIEAPLATDSASGTKPPIMIGWRGCSAATGTTKPYPITITSGGIALNGAVTMSSTLHVVGVSTFESYLNIQAGIRPNANDARYVGTSSYRFNEGYINNMYTNAVYVGKGTTYGFKSDGSINATLINATNDIITSARLYAPHLFLGRNTEGIYLTSNGVSWHNSSNAWASSLMGFTSTSIIAHQSITANSGVKVASGQALTFLDASGKEHKLTYDSTAGAFKFDGNILVLGDGQFNAIN